MVSPKIAGVKRRPESSPLGEPAPKRQRIKSPAKGLQPPADQGESAISAAQKIFDQPRVCKNQFRNFSLRIVRQLCEVNGLPIVKTGKRGDKILREDCIRAILRAKDAAKFLSGGRRSPKQGPIEGETTGMAIHPGPHTGVLVDPYGTHEGQHGLTEEFLTLAGIEPGEQARPEVGSEVDFMEVDPELSTCPTSTMARVDITVRLYENPKDWNHQKEVACSRESDGSVNLEKLQLQLGYPEKKLVAITPKRLVPLFPYSKTVLIAPDVNDCLENNILQEEEETRGMIKLRQWRIKVDKLAAAFSTGFWISMSRGREGFSGYWCSIQVQAEYRGSVSVGFESATQDALKDMTKDLGDVKATLQEALDLFGGI
ncbi:hypothetical protein DFP72DRAFT_855723 [Ephemerocybe angulata]|uniref:Uncharacterized protein n=1 Tax=Ephemerocybe angulata TaxID=980116 RepID=A0A8H6HFK4_9AGAR|nr:hypothetical protein DFP72DRAFT_855723 [Tulosesus angulatus]